MKLDADGTAMTLSDVDAPVSVSAPVAASVSGTREPYLSFSLSLFPAAMGMEETLRSMRLDPSASYVSGLLPYPEIEIDSWTAI